MIINPVIRTSYLWLVLTFLANCALAAGLTWPQDGGAIGFIVALPVLFLAFPLSVVAAFGELPKETRESSWVRSQRSRAQGLFAGMLVVLFFGLVPYMQSKGLATGFGLFTCAALLLLEITIFYQTFRLYVRHRERCVLCALVTQFLAFIPAVWVEAGTLIEIAMEANISF